MGILEKAEQYFIKCYEESDIQVDYPEHLREMIKWIDYLLNKFPNADREIVLLSAWFHDLGDILYGDKFDHAVTSEQEARKFLSKYKYDSDKLEKVAHCVRAHRNKDVKPQTLEAKLTIVADSVSHFTMCVYIRRLNQGRDGMAKLERDYADLELLPGIQEQMKPFYEAWKNLITLYPKL